MSDTYSAGDLCVKRIVGAIRDAVIVVSAGGGISWANPAACRMFGYEEKEFYTFRWSELFVLEPQQLRALWLSIENGESTIEPSPFLNQWFSVGLIRQGGGRFNGEANCITLPGSAKDKCAFLIRDLSEQLRAQETSAALAESNELLQALVDAALEGLIIHQNGEILYANRVAERTSRVPTGRLVGKSLFDFIAAQSVELVKEKVRARDDRPYTALGKRANGEIYPVEVQTRTSPVLFRGKPARVAAFRDISERLVLEEQVRQSHKMEAVGRLAGGIAHDFNNLVSVIMGATALASRKIPADHDSNRDLAVVQRAADRAASLTRQLLAFSRLQVVQPKIIDVRSVVFSLEPMLRRVLGEDIQLVLSSSGSNWRIKGDPAQIENMILNLIVNSRDAMPDGGVVAVEIQSKILDETFANTHLGLKPGLHVLIVVTDTGVGMDADTKARIFEPFFTTKGQGRGTGLGLSSVFGIVKQGGGSIWVDSEPGHGTSFKICFPATEEPCSEEPQIPSSQRTVFAKKILLVEDETLLRSVLVEVLRDANYDVLEAEGPLKAIELAKQHAGNIALLITDVVMPEMNGKQLHDKLVAEYPQLRVLFISGYAEEALAKRGAIDPSIHFLPKPFSMETMLNKVQQMLQG